MHRGSQAGAAEATHCFPACLPTTLPGASNKDIYTPQLVLKYPSLIYQLFLFSKKIVKSSFCAFPPSPVCSISQTILLFSIRISHYFFSYLSQYWLQRQICYVTYTFCVVIQWDTKKRWGGGDPWDREQRVSTLQQLETIFRNKACWQGEMDPARHCICTGLQLSICFLSYRVEGICLQSYCY